MAQPTYSARVIVLGKTKLGESDLILTLLAQDGSQLRAVAKGARKPQSSFSSRLELFCEVDLLCVRGRSLDIVKEARLVRGAENLRVDVARATAAAPVAELLGKVSQPGLENAVLFASTSAALATLDACSEEAAPAITAAQLLKLLAYAGFRPTFDACASCGHPARESGAGEAAFSFTEGGVVCRSCRRQVDAQLLDAHELAWASALLSARFSQITQDPPPAFATFAALRLAQGLIQAHIGSRLKSQEFMLTCGLYE